MTNRIRRSIIHKKDLRVEKPEQVAIQGNRFALLGEGGFLQLVERGQGEKPKFIYSCRLGWQPDSLELSASGKYALLRAHAKQEKLHKRLVIWDWERGFAAADFEFPETLWYTFGLLYEAAGSEVLMFSEVTREGARLKAFRIGDMSPLFKADLQKPHGLRITHLCPVLGDGDTFCVLGYLDGEGKDSLYSFSVNAIMTNRPPSHYRCEMTGQINISDYTENIAAGWCGGEQVIIYRNPEEDSEPGEGEGDEYDLIPADEIWGFNGFYIRRLPDGKLVERIGCKAAIPTGAPIFAAGETIAALCPSCLHVFSRRDGTEIRKIPNIASGPDPKHGQVILINDHEDLEILSLY